MDEVSRSEEGTDNGEEDSDDDVGNLHFMHSIEGSSSNLNWSGDFVKSIEWIWNELAWFNKNSDHALNRKFTWQIYDDFWNILFVVHYFVSVIITTYGWKIFLKSNS